LGGAKKKKVWAPFPHPEGGKEVVGSEGGLNFWGKQKTTKNGDCLILRGGGGGAGGWGWGVVGGGNFWSKNPAMSRDDGKKKRLEKKG